MTHDPEALRRMDELAVAKSIVSEHEAWLTKYAKQHGELEHAGLWAGPRQSFREVTNPELALLALKDMLEIFTVEQLFAEKDGSYSALQKLDKTLRANRENEEVRPKWLACLDYHGGEEGTMITEYGNVQAGPITSRPSEEHYVILQPGEEARK